MRARICELTIRDENNASLHKLEHRVIEAKHRMAKLASTKLMKVSAGGGRLCRKCVCMIMPVGASGGILHSTSPPTQTVGLRYDDELPVVNTMPKNIQLEMQHHSIIIQQITGTINGLDMGPLTTKVKNYKVRECVGS